MMLSFVNVVVAMLFEFQAECIVTYLGQTILTVCLCLPNSITQTKACSHHKEVGYITRLWLPYPQNDQQSNIKRRTGCDESKPFDVFGNTTCTENRENNNSDYSLMMSTTDCYSL